MSAELQISSEERIQAAVQNQEMDAIEAYMQATYPPVKCEINHTFTKGDGKTGQIYSRTILMKSGSVVTSKIHKFEHPFFVMSGYMIWYNENPDEPGAIHIKAPYMGVTQPGTRRLIFIVQDVLMTACYATDLTDVAEIERTIIHPHFVPENTYQPELTP